MILVTGGAGAMGSRLARFLAASGRRVRVLALSGDPAARRLEGSGCEVVTGDITDRASLVGPMRGATTVYHLAAVIVSRDPTVFARVNVEGTRNVVDAACAAGVRHLVYVSSASVTYAHQTPYSLSKREGERIVRGSSGLGWTIVRPTLVYDRRGGQEIEMLREWICRLPVVPLVGAGRARKRPVFAGDVIGALAAVAGNDLALGKTYNLSGGEAISILELARLLARQMRLSRTFLPLPERVWRAALRPAGALAEHVIAAFTQDADLDNSEARRDLGFDPLPASVGIPRYFHRRA